MWLLAILASGPESTTGLDPFLQYGAIGAIAVLGVVFFRAAYKRESERADKLEAEVQRLNQVIQDKYVPALEATSAALQESSLVLTIYQREAASPRRRTPP